MISKIINWVGGGLFRTIGRFLAFIIIGFILATIVSKNNIKITDLLGIETVKALSLDGTIVGQYDVLNSEKTVIFNLSCAGTSECGDQNGFTFDHYYGSDSRADYMIFSYTAYFKHWDSSPNPSYEVYDNEINDLQLMFRIYFNENGQGNYDICEQQNNLIVCPIKPNRSYRNLWVSVLLPGSQNTPDSHNNYYIQFYGRTTLMKSNGQAIIDNQNQNHNETMSFFNDTNSTETDSTANSFFSNFTDTDHGGLSSIITAPLSTINAMLSNQCVQPSATWKGATISLPCGDMFWSREGASGLKNLLNVFYGGFVCYYAIRRLFLLIEQLKDPTNDRIEVLDL